MLADPKLKFPFYFPTLRTSGAAYAGTEPRIYTIRDEKGKKHEAYRLVVSKGLAGEYYGIQGMTWKDPPILDNPDEMRTSAAASCSSTTTAAGCGWSRGRPAGRSTGSRTRSSQSLNKRQMLAIAESLTRLKQ